MNIIIEQLLHPRNTPLAEIEKRFRRLPFSSKAVASLHQLLRELDEVIKIGQSSHDRHVFVALDGDTAIGTVALIPITRADENHSILSQVYVKKSHRRRGIGRALVLAAIDHARYRLVFQPSRMQYVLASVPRTARTAREFFKHCRFRSPSHHTAKDPIVEFRSDL